MVSIMQEQVRKVAFISSYRPRRCGIATFTSDLVNNMSLAGGGELDVKTGKMNCNVNDKRTF